MFWKKSKCVNVLKECTPIYETMPGWQTDLSALTDKKELPQKALDYISFVEEQMGCTASIISVGPRRDQTMILDSLF